MSEIIEIATRIHPLDLGELLNDSGVKDVFIKNGLTRVGGRWYKQTVDVEPQSPTAKEKWAAMQQGGTVA